jgi:membrane fusion protein, copper/silver efflux system
MSRRSMSAPAQRITIATTALAAIIILGGTAWTLASRRQNRPVNKAEGVPDMPGMTGHASSGMYGVANGPGTGTNGSITLTASQIRQFGVTFGTAEVRRVTSEVRAAGVVTFDETKMAQIAPRFGGFVEKLYVNSTGQQVRRGQAVLDIYSPELVAAQQELLLAAQLDRSIGASSVPGVAGGQTNLVEASKRRLQLWDVSDAQISQILSSGRVRRTLTLYAPVSGIVVEKKVLQGQAVTPGEDLYTIANLSDVWVDAELREIDAANVRVGTAADIDFTGLPGHAYKGRVAYVYPTLQAEARTIKARIVVPNTDHVLKPGMYATVRLSTPSRSALTVPNSAVLQTGVRNIVFVDMGNGEIMPHDVQPGRVAGGYTEILSGLEAKQRVVTSAQFLLDSESNLGEVIKSMIANMGPGDKAMQNMPGMSDKGASVRDMPGMQMPDSSVRPPR